jgi:hypothetical protein
MNPTGISSYTRPGLINPYNIWALFERITIDIVETSPESKKGS